MKAVAQQPHNRTYGVRIQADPKVQQALNIEQNNRHKAVNCIGPKERLIDILADWVEEKADTVIQQGEPS